MRWKNVFSFSRHERMVRIGRLMWDRGTVGDGEGHSSKLSLALEPRLFAFGRQYGGWEITLFGVRVHFLRSWGGRFV